MGKLCFGMPTLVELNTFEENIALCRELSLDFIELNMNLPQFQTDKLDVAKLLEVQRESDIYFTFHLPEELDIANFNEKIKRAYLDIVKETIELAKAVEAPIINMHMNLGVYFTMPNYKIYLYGKYRKHYLDSMAEFCDFVDSWIGESTINISIENTGIYSFKYITEAIEKLLNSKSFSLTWDVGHDHSAGEVDKEFIVSNLNRLKHMHLHDAIGKNNHLPIFSGDINIQDRLNTAITTGSSCVLETKTIEGLKKFVEKLRKLWY
jgi:sugar phosphate isomerase/epimerase